MTPTLKKTSMHDAERDDNTDAGEDVDGDDDGNTDKRCCHRSMPRANKDSSDK
jgi:hypothetical protein